MRILSWVQNKFKKGQVKRMSNTDTLMPEASRDEFSDWPQGLLTIGTFGNNQLKEESKNSGLQIPSQDIPELTLEEVIKLQEELNKLFSQKPKSRPEGLEKGRDEDKLTSDTFPNCSSSLALDRKMNLENNSAGFNDDEDGSLSPNTKVILNKAKDILVDKRGAIRERSISFLLKKTFGWRSGFGPSPSLRDPLQDSKMEKLLRAILAKKIYPQSSASTSMKKYLERKPTEKKHEGERVEDGCKWVKTDSEYIVLEI